jgi:hypothetical protein
MDSFVPWNLKVWFSMPLLFPLLRILICCQLTPICDILFRSMISKKSKVLAYSTLSNLVFQAFSRLANKASGWIVPTEIVTPFRRNFLQFKFFVQIAATDKVLLRRSEPTDWVKVEKDLNFRPFSSCHVPKFLFYFTFLSVGVG